MDARKKNIPALDANGRRANFAIKENESITKISLITMYGFILLYVSTETNKRSLRNGNGDQMNVRIQKSSNDERKKVCFTENCIAHWSGTWTFWLWPCYAIRNSKWYIFLSCILIFYWAQLFFFCSQPTKSCAFFVCTVSSLSKNWMCCYVVSTYSCDTVSNQ